MKRLLLTTLLSICIGMAFCQEGEYLHFDAFDDEMYIQDFNFFNNDFTVAFWANPELGSNPHYLLTQGTNNVNAQLHIGWRNANRVTFAFFGNDLDVIYTPDNVWHHYTFTYDKNNGDRKIYVDGVLLGMDNAQPLVSSGVLRIGDAAELGDHFGGGVQKLEVWDRLLSPEEINQAQSCPIDTMDTSLRLLFNFQQGIAGGDNTGITIDESSQYSYNIQVDNFNFNGNESNFMAPGPVAPEEKLDIVEMDQGIAIGDSLRLSNHQFTYCTLPIYQWFFDSVPIADADSSVLIKADMTLQDAGTYYLRGIIDSDTLYSDTVAIVVYDCNQPEIGPDADSDGFNDFCDNCPLQANAGQLDSDGDGVGDTCDICLSDYDPDQEDIDGDGIGDMCDVCPLVYNADQLDSDGDGLGDVCDNCPNVYNPTIASTTHVIRETGFSDDWDAVFIQSISESARGYRMRITRSGTLHKAILNVSNANGINTLEYSLHTLVNDLPDFSEDGTLYKDTVELHYPGGSDFAEVHLDFEDNIGVNIGDEYVLIFKMLSGTLSILYDESYTSEVNSFLAQNPDNGKYSWTSGNIILKLLVKSESQIDTDRDGTGDLCDLCPQYDRYHEDADGDGLIDACDNCPENYNSDQGDTDGDYLGDICDLCIDQSSSGNIHTTIPLVQNNDEGFASVGNENMKEFAAILPIDTSGYLHRFSFRQSNLTTGRIYSIEWRSVNNGVIDMSDKGIIGVDTFTYNLLENPDEEILATIDKSNDKIYVSQGDNIAVVFPYWGNSFLLRLTNMSSNLYASVTRTVSTGTEPFELLTDQSLTVSLEIETLQGKDSDGDTYGDECDCHPFDDSITDSRDGNYFVNKYNTSQQDGYSWSSGFNNLYQALDDYCIEPGDTVFVSQGSYRPSSGEIFMLPEGVAILGGYSPTSGEQNTDMYTTILDGEVVEDVEFFHRDSLIRIVPNGSDIETIIASLKIDNVNAIGQYTAIQKGETDLVLQNVEIDRVNYGDLGLIDLEGGQLRVESGTTGLYGGIYVPPYAEDYDGNIYETVVVDDQVFTATGLITTHYQDGTPIDRIEVNQEWEDTVLPAYSWSDPDSVLAHIQGHFYKGYAIHPSLNGNKNICPNGWRVPTRSEWENLVNDMENEDIDDGVYYPYLRSTADDAWAPPFVATNDSGMSIRGTGVRRESGNVHHKLLYGYVPSIGSATELSVFQLQKFSNIATQFQSYSIHNGYTVRCIYETIYD